MRLPSVVFTHAEVAMPNQTPIASQNPDVDVQRWLLTTCQALVDRPDAVKVSTSAGREAVLFEVNCAPDDIKRLIGRKGGTADALRSILACFSGRARRLRFRSGGPCSTSPRDSGPDLAAGDSTPTGRGGNRPERRSCRLVHDSRTSSQPHRPCRRTGPGFARLLVVL